jgi:V/A-type H+-transporting ATPase subunit C
MNTQQDYLSYKENTKYGYASGRLRVMETRLLNRNAIMRLLEADSAHETMRMISEGDYANAFSGITQAIDFDTGLKLELERVYKLIDELSLDPELTGIFRAKWDFHNLKVLLKASYLAESKLSFDEALSSLGSIPIETLRLAVDPNEEKKEGILPDYIQSALEDARIQYDSTQNPQMIDIIIDYHSHSFMFEQASKYKNKFLCGYFEAIADLNNIRNFIRIKMLNENIRLLDAVLLPFGNIERKVFLQHFDDSVESLGSVLNNTSYGELVIEAIRRWSDENSLSTFEKLADNYLVNYLKPAKYIVFGIEPLVAYLLAKEHEIKVLRIIMIGKINDVPTEIINERLRETYV